MCRVVENGVRALGKKRITSLKSIEKLTSASRMIEHTIFCSRRGYYQGIKFHYNLWDNAKIYWQFFYLYIMVTFCQSRVVHYISFYFFGVQKEDMYVNTSVRSYHSYKKV